MKYKLNDIVRVVWMDAASRDAWSCIADMVSADEVTSMGVVMHMPKKDKDYLVIVSSIDKAHEMMFGQLAIPRLMISKVTVLK